MTYKVRIYLRLAPAETRYHYIGEISREGSDPIQAPREGTARCIEVVSPFDWDKRGVIPVLHVVLSPHEIPEEKPRRERQGE